MDSKLANSVWSMGIGQIVDSVCIYVRSDAIPTQDEECHGSSFLHKVPVAQDMPGLDTHKPSGKYDK